MSNKTLVQKLEEWFVLAYGEHEPSETVFDPPLLVGLTNKDGTEGQMHLTKACYRKDGKTDWHLISVDPETGRIIKETTVKGIDFNRPIRPPEPETDEPVSIHMQFSCDKPRGES